MSGIALQGFRCHACRNAAFRSFAAISGLSSSTRRPQSSISYPGSKLYQRHVRTTGRRQFSALGSVKSQADSDIPTKTETKEDASAESSHIPWYLQDESHKPSSHPLKQQELPPLPENPPPILENLLQYISVDAGLDDLALLDLRGLDPPPALGANLIMIIGTARSVKHLNVSGDRLCRWLRSNYQLRPIADGLLGRNELKIKLRRRARKAKATGDASSLNSRDDGITTGWICVNVGDVENGPLKTKNSQNRNFIGFGGTEDKVRIVVQMLVEEKRSELQLEALWGNLLNPEAGEINPAPRDDVWGDLSSETTSSVKGVDSIASTFSQRFPGRRYIHTQARPNTPEPLSHETLDDIVQESRPALPSKIVSTSMASPSVSSLLEQLSQLPEEEARRELGLGPGDRDSTLFLRLFYEAVSKSDTETVLLDKLSFARAAVLLKHPAYSKTDLYRAFKSMAAFGCDISEELAMDTVRTLLSFQGPENATNERVPEQDIDLALRVLEHMSLRGIKIFNGEVFFLLHKASALQSHVLPANDTPRATNAPADPDSISKVPVEELDHITIVHNRLSKLMASANVDFNYKDYPELLKMYFEHGNYSNFWRLWHRIPLMQIPRTKELYLLMFRLHAKLGNQRQAVDCLSSWVPMMAREQPPVALDEELTRAIMACMLVADPAIDQKTDDGTVSQFTRLWKQCLRDLESFKAANSQ
ncbi:ATPase synthesis protein 25, mitochondrial [Trichophyton rubrum D6]|uniref:ATPase synthesis protein 25 n=4 Tax=Trichophyton TaxID=5550 RepID=A0A178EZU6_TRIRU|nr:ATPase synthesis protein 25, mitochondrial [Trichophyton rubrum CBS 118892]EZF23291.1 ATPase synthesis protein 25, mitochondrial [Trichophyton rubrum MR850]EZF42430.1 ATPase synthesis protein 25, mitochondrial [Trichophyton rubrum CBS 100081]EZF52926.1 ATPase synthesis protein 25, mitochondrial [Trichophyton rubrum CBS 288.86]EZF63566.1 ATPase synthesis protein 25, mitochondrial [Trichophyton rubrum CBS 289.86]EZF74339.1 ATPase synthesis protein 25, mitochondrial [Trichophyton soudanense CB